MDNTSREVELLSVLEQCRDIFLSYGRGHLDQAKDRVRDTLGRSNLADLRFIVDKLEKAKANFNLAATVETVIYGDDE